MVGRGGGCLVGSAVGQVDRQDAHRGAADTQECRGRHDACGEVPNACGAVIWRDAADFGVQQQVGEGTSVRVP